MVAATKFVLLKLFPPILRIASPPGLPLPRLLRVAPPPAVRPPDGRDHGWVEIETRRREERPDGPLPCAKEVRLDRLTHSPFSVVFLLNGLCWNFPRLLNPPPIERLVALNTEREFGCVEEEKTFYLSQKVSMVYTVDGPKKSERAPHP